MEIIISIFLGVYLMFIGIISYVRIRRDFKGGKK